MPLFPWRGAVATWRQCGDLATCPPQGPTTAASGISVRLTCVRQLEIKLGTAQDVAWVGLLATCYQSKVESERDDKVKDV